MQKKKLHIDTSLHLIKYSFSKLTLSGPDLTPWWASLGPHAACLTPLCYGDHIDGITLKDLELTRAFFIY